MSPPKDVANFLLEVAAAKAKDLETKIPAPKAGPTSFFNIKIARIPDKQE